MTVDAKGIFSGMRTSLFLFVTLLAMCSEAYSGPSITDVKFYNAIEVNKIKQPEKLISDSISRNNVGKLYARFVIIGTADTIRHLEESGYLSVKLEWSHNNKVLDSIEVGISQEKWELGENELKRQVEEQGFFSYRTYSFRSYIPAGTYKVTVRDGSGNILSPQAFEGPGIYQPTLEVKGR